MVWRHGDKVLSSSSKCRLWRDGSRVELVIYNLQGADAGVYSCDTGSRRTSAVLTVQGRSENLSWCPTSSQNLSMICISLHLEIQISIFSTAFEYPVTHLASFPFLTFFSDVDPRVPDFALSSKTLTHSAASLFAPSLNNTSTKRSLDLIPPPFPRLLPKHNDFAEICLSNRDRGQHIEILGELRGVRGRRRPL